MGTEQLGTTRINIRDINPLEHLTSDLAKARFNNESILNGLVEWNSSKLKDVTVRLMCDTEPGFVDYTFPTKAAASGNGGNVAEPYTVSNAYSYGARYPISAMISTNPKFNDIVDARITVNESAGSNWKLCESVVLYEEQQVTEVMTTDENVVVEHDSDYSEGEIIVKDDTDASVNYIPGQFMRIYYPEYGYCSIRWVYGDISKGDTINDYNSHRVIGQWTLDRLDEYRDPHAEEYLFAVYDGKVYRPTGTIGRSVPSDSSSGWEYYCDVYSDNAPLVHGRVYLYDPEGGSGEVPYGYSEFFVYTGDDSAYAYPPYGIETGEGGAPERNYNGGWADSSVILLPVSGEFNKTNAVRIVVGTDIESLVLLRTDDGSVDKVPDIELKANVRIVGGTTEDNGGLKIFDTSNYSEWPGTAPKWSAGHAYVTDTTKGVGRKQDYTASMVFEHANPDCKECNIVNYDGPDLDMGLAIYLPVECTVDGTVMYPKNGRMFEFLFRIWPNPAYNGHETADLIINKSQIYVYSVPNRNSLECGVEPIAKFSMARLTNFYVFAENIAVPNRPVLIKARFVYSEETKSWMTYDYYQVPDCIFLSPNGFVDPNRPSDETYGVETAGFPLMQDPFSGYDLSPVMVDDNYRNRIG